MWDPIWVNILSLKTESLNRSRYQSYKGIFYCNECFFIYLLFPLFINGKIEINISSLSTTTLFINIMYWEVVSLFEIFYHAYKNNYNLHLFGN